MNDEELLLMAKGIPPESFEAQQLLYWNTVYDPQSPSRDERNEHFLQRREARKAVYFYRRAVERGETPDEKYKFFFETFIKPQLDSNLAINLKSFTFKWDIHPVDPRRVVIKENWLKEGGGFDVDTSAHAPTAFTMQE